MKNSSFGDLLTEGIYAIQNIESKNKKKSVREIEDELAKSIRRNAGTIEWFRKGNIPTAQFETEELARVIFVRGIMNVIWLEHFLKSARHPNWTSLRDELISLPNDQGGEANRTLYRRIKMHIDKQLLLNGITKTFREIEIEATSETPLSSIRHRIITSGASIQDFYFEVNKTYREDNGEIKGRILLRNANIYTWLIEFLPPLLQGKHAYYSYVTSNKGSNSLTSEEVRKQHLEGTRSYDFENWGVTITAPTENLNMCLTFPMKYPISLPVTGGFGVYQGLNDVLEEKTRIILLGGFSARFDQEAEQWSLELTVVNAKLGFRYELQWSPPSESMIKELV